MLTVTPEMKLASEQTGLPERTRSPEVLVLATEVEVVSLAPISPGHDQETEVAPPSVHVTLLVVLPEKVSLPDIEVPASSVVAVNSAVGQVILKPNVGSNVNTVLVEVNEILVLAGVIAACAGGAAAADAGGIATASRSPRVVALPICLSSGEWCVNGDAGRRR